MSLTRFTADLLRKGAILWVEGGELCFRVSKEISTPALRQELKEHKGEMIPLLGANKKYAPSSFAQQRLWFLSQLEGEEAGAYLIPSALRLAGALDPSALYKALREVVVRHEALRTTFTALDGEVVQVIVPALEVPPALVDLSGLRLRDQEAEIQRLAREHAGAGFNLGQGPLIRFTLLRLGAAEHVFLVNMHHIISDGWSIGVLVKETVLSYSAKTEGRASPLPPLEVQYADYAVWQRSRLSGEVLQSRIDYWRKRLAGLSPLSVLPADFPRPAVQTFSGRRQAFTLDAESSKRLNILSRKRDATLFMTLAAAFAVLLGRYSGRRDLAMGTPIAGRTRREIEDLIGFFVNTLVLRADLSGNPPFDQLLERMKQTCLDAYAHQDVPFERLVEELNPARSLSHSPLFQVMFILQNNRETDFSRPGLRVEPLETEQAASKFDLTLEMTEGADGLTGRLEYNTDLFRPETIERLAGHFRNLLKGIGSNPATLIGDLPLMTESERREVLAEFNRTQADYPRDKTVHELFEEQAQRIPQAAALAFEEQTLTYAELNAQANRLAHRLRGLGVGPDVLVGVCLDRSPGMVLGLLGILKAGGAYVPLDPDYPRERSAYMMADSGARVLITESNQLPVNSHQSSGLPFAAVETTHVSRHHYSPLKVVYLDTDREIISQQNIDNPNIEIFPSNLAYVIYTSGSTGKPKGVAGTHSALVNRLDWMEKTFPCRRDEKHVQKTSIGFIDSLTETLLPLIVGAQLHIADHETAIDPDKLGDFIHARAIDRLTLAPSLLEALLRSDFRAIGEKLKLIVSSGEALRQTVAEEAQRKLFATTLINLYGSSEVAGDVAYYKCTAKTGKHKPIPIGGPIANTRIYILDGEARPVPIGVPGELYIGGAQVARGYLNRPELTAEKFVPDPFGSEPGARLYRTGDLGRWLADGAIEYLGRGDFQVKIRGFRIELGEIEEALRRHGRVREAIVAVREESAGDKRLAAYLVPADGILPDINELRNELKSRLPEYMVPSAFVVLEKLPLTPNGKVDRKALPAPEYRACAAAHVAPRTRTERTLAGIFGEVLKSERIGIHDNFFELGGHSLLAARVAAHVRAAFEVALPVRNLFEFPTVAELAEGIERLRRSGAVSSLPPLIPETRPAEIPLSFSQQQMWEQNRLEPDNPHYAISTATSLTGGLNIPALRRTLNEIVKRHESLRTRIDTVNGKAIQKIDVFLDIGLPVIDLQFLPPGTREAQLERLAKAEERKPFDTAREPLVRASLVRLAPAQHVLLLTIHHIVADGWSMGILVEEMNVLYSAFCKGRPAPLAPLAVQYADFAVWQRKWLQGEILEKELAFWKQKTAGDLHAPEPRFDRPRPQRPTRRGSFRIYRTAAVLTNALRKLSREEGCTLFMTFLAVFKVFLYACTGREDLFVCAPVANRRLPELEKLIGHFVHSLFLRTNFRGNPGFRDLLQRVKETALEAYQHQDLPLARWIRESASAEALRRCPFFNLLNFTEPKLALPGLEVDELFIPESAAAHDLELWVKEQGPSIRFDLIGNTDVYTEQTLDRLMERFAAILNAVAGNPDSTLRELAEFPSQSG